MSTEINVVKFIRRIREHRILWDFTHPENKNIREKTLVWRELSKEFGVSVEVLKKRWKWLRDSYSRERNRQTSGRSGDSTWRYWKYLQFLKGHYKIRETLSTIEDMIMKDELQVEDGYSSSQEQDNVPSTSDPTNSIEICPAYSETETETDPLVPQNQNDEYTKPPGTFKNFLKETGKPPDAKKGRDTAVNQNIEDGLMGAMGSIQSYINKLQECTETADASDDEDELFFRSIVKKIKKFPLKTKNEVKLHIFSYLNEVEIADMQN